MRQDVGRFRAVRAALFALLLSGFWGGAVFARSDPGETATAAICDRAAEAAARASGVPLDVLRAISLTETGRKRGGRLAPWPWTVNMEGVGKWFDTRAEAEAYVRAHHGRGARSFDVGCFQINFRWHGAAFADALAMFDPEDNAAYAARFLKDLFDEMGDWSRAAGAYHSRTPKYASRYRARFDRLRAGLGPSMGGMAVARRDGTRQDSPRRIERRSIRGPAGPGAALNLAGVTVAPPARGSLFGGDGAGLLRAARPLFGRGGEGG